MCVRYICRAILKVKYFKKINLKEKEKGASFLLIKELQIYMYIIHPSKN